MRAAMAALVMVIREHHCATQVYQQANRDLEDHHCGSDTDDDASAPFRVRKVRHEIVSLSETGMISAMHQTKATAARKNYPQKSWPKSAADAAPLRELSCVPQSYCEPCIARERTRQCCHTAKNEIRISIVPNVQTIAAPDGRSHQKERNNPAIPPSHAIIHPMSKR